MPDELIADIAATLGALVFDAAAAPAQTSAPVPAPNPQPTPLAEETTE
ncbi:hypothetical protein ARTSIC4J27_583 [Pseudarthrobacter siccitolerans]|uniref:Uncharacterized protein n=1 Tax=Pseudarthrobacter siccitolerans TaxID=861266 RepID=A0A024GYU7_9MICC|nr:hypothetical protein ARTSIC4J27_583 [Pseudarthrobacter siccitolerans]